MPLEQTTLLRPTPDYQAIQATFPPKADPEIQQLLAGNDGYAVRDYYINLLKSGLSEAKNEPTADRAYVYAPSLLDRSINGAHFMEVGLEPLMPQGHRVGSWSPWEKETTIAEEMRDMATIAKMEYKIHLMPKPEFRSMVIRRLMQARKTDPQIQALLAELKVLFIQNNSAEEGIPIQPEIVICTKLGKHNALELLRRIVALFADCQAEIGLGICPRGNMTIPDNSLVYCAQGSWDIKSAYEGKRKRLFASDSSVPKIDETLTRFEDGETPIVDLLNSDATIDDAAELELAEQAMERLQIIRLKKSDAYEYMAAILYNFHPEDEEDLNNLNRQIGLLETETGLSRQKILDIAENNGLKIPPEAIE